MLEHLKARFVKDKKKAEKWALDTAPKAGIRGSMQLRPAPQAKVEDMATDPRTSWSPHQTMKNPKALQNTNPKGAGQQPCQNALSNPKGKRGAVATSGDSKECNPLHYF